jgi:hypothetical protein
VLALKTLRQLILNSQNCWPILCLATPSLRPNHPSTSLTRSISNIDGGADVYLLYDFQLLLHGEFKAVAALR